MDKLKLEVRRRMDMRKSHIKKLKAEHYVPGNVYGHGQESISIEVNLGELAGIAKTEHGLRSLIGLSVEGVKGRPELVVVKNLKKDPITRRVQHVEFQRVSLTEKIATVVPIVLTGDSTGVESGGMLEHVIREAHIKCLADNIPDAIGLDITDVEIGQHKCLGDLSLPEGVEIVGHPEDVVIVIKAPIVHAAEAEKPAEEAEEGAAAPETSEES